MKVTINVTARDIKYGERCDGQACPVARALKRTKWGKDIHCFTVGAYKIVRFYGDRSPQSLDLPPEAGQFVRDFDSGVMVEPISFTVDVPE